ncbi:hypothetical protein V8V91_24570 [Algoriphagus halophilus]|uniref:hypothetical protein n=1 Tax=Algoriphagus halophilus TaxID=226505 RepID=UPI00358EDA0E
MDQSLSLVRPIDEFSTDVNHSATLKSSSSEIRDVEEDISQRIGPIDPATAVAMIIDSLIEVADLKKKR